MKSRSRHVLLAALLCWSALVDAAPVSPGGRCVVSASGEQRVIPVTAQPDGLNGVLTDIGSFSVRAFLATHPSAPWLQIDVYRAMSDGERRILSSHQVPLAQGKKPRAAQAHRAVSVSTGRVDVIDPLLGHTLTYECTSSASPHASFVVVGDVMLAKSEATGQMIERGEDPFAGVRAVLQAQDLRIANFESAAGRLGVADPAKPYSFIATEKAVTEFATVFDAASLANNHAVDFGREALLETERLLKQAGSTPFGAGADARQAHQAAMIERNGLKIALLAYLHVFPRWFAAAPGLPGTAWLDPKQSALDIRSAKARGADVVLVIPHWGTEHEGTANSTQRQLARALIDAGASAVIGAHPHVTQDYEIYRGRPIFYSLGNFVFDGFEDADNNTGWAVFGQLDRQGVKSLHTRVFSIDATGSPRPDPTQAGVCWQRGQRRIKACAPQ